MARDLSTILADKEDIISYECNFVSKIINILIGIGNIDKNGVFIPQPNQTYRTYSIIGAEFDTLMEETSTKPAGVFRKEDLWEPVDRKNAELQDVLFVGIEELPPDVKSKDKI